MLDKILENYQEDEFLIPTGLDEACIGVEESTMRLIYSKKKCIEILSREMTHEQAQEHFDFNIKGGYVGEQTPIWCEDDFE